MSESVFFATRDAGVSNVNVKVFSPESGLSGAMLVEEFKRFLVNNTDIADVKKEVHTISEDNGYCLISAKQGADSEFKLIGLAKAARTELYRDRKQVAGVEDLSIGDAFYDVRSIVDSLMTNGILKTNLNILQASNNDGNKDIPLIFIALIETNEDEKLGSNKYFGKYATNDPLFSRVVYKQPGPITTPSDQTFKELRKTIATATRPEYKELSKLIESMSPPIGEISSVVVRLTRYSNGKNEFTNKVNTESLIESMVPTSEFLNGVKEAIGRNLCFSQYEINPINDLQFVVSGSNNSQQGSYKLLPKPLINAQDVEGVAEIVKGDFKGNAFTTNALAEILGKYLFSFNFGSYKFFSKDMLTTKFGTPIDLSDGSTGKATEMCTTLELGRPWISVSVSPITSRVYSHEDYRMISWASGDTWLYSSIHSKAESEYSSMSVVMFKNMELAVNKMVMDLTKLIEESGDNNMMVSIDDIEATLDYFNVPKSTNAKRILA